jgi:hypothetical protein
MSQVLSLNRLLHFGGFCGQSLLSDLLWVDVSGYFHLVLLHSLQVLF